MSNLIKTQRINQHSCSNLATANSIKLAGILLTVGIFTTSCTTSKHQTLSTKPSQIKKGPTVALVLGGGGAKGFAHVGVIKTLEANDISPDLIVGTSVGSFVGSLYASGKTASQLEQLALITPDSALTDLTLSYQGIIEGQKLRDFVNSQVNQSPIESFPKKFAAIAAEKHTLKKAIFTSGEPGLVVQASSSVPNIFIAPRIPDPAKTGIVGTKYVDGGVVSIVPVDTAKSLGADVVIAVDLQVNVGNKPQNTDIGSLFNTHSLNVNKNTIWSLLERGYQTYMNGKNNKKGPYAQNYYALNKAEIARADIIIRPEVSDISPINTSDRKKAIAAGEIATKQSLPQIVAAIKTAKSLHQ